MLAVSLSVRAMRLSPSIALLRTQTDARLTALAREGNEAAFTALVERYRRLVLSACRRVLPEARAEDAVQQVFLSAWNALGRGDDVRDVRPWLLRIARNTSLNVLRAPGYDYDELAGSLEGGVAPEAEVERRDVMRQTLAGLAALPENQREALLRSAVQGAAHADIARDLGLSEGATRQLVLRARSSLRAAVSAVTPLPLLNWIATHADRGGGGEAAVRLAEAAAGGSAAGASALLAKVGTVAVIAGGAAVAPAIVDGGREPARAATQAPAKRSSPERDGGRAAAAPAPVNAATTVTPDPTAAPRRSRPHAGGKGKSAAESARTLRQPRRADRRPSGGSQNSPRSPTEDDEDDHSGSGKANRPSGKDNSGSGKHKEPEEPQEEEETPRPTVEAPEKEHGGKGSGSGEEEEPEEENGSHGSSP